MPRRRFYDVPGGDTIIYDIVDESNGYRQATFMFEEANREEHFRSIRGVKCRDDDIFLNTYPKTGTHWTWEMISMMINKTPEVGGAYKLVGMLEAFPVTVLDDILSPRILNTHIKVKYIPEETVLRKLKTIIVLRNPKDVAVAFYNHSKGVKVYDYDGKFENYLHMFMKGEVDWGSYPEYLLEWQQHIRNNPDVPFHIIYYEDMKENCVEELKKLKSFLGLDVSDGLLQEIADNCSINKMRASKSAAVRENPKSVELANTFNKPGFNMLRKGEIGDWKNWFTVAQSEMFDAWWEKEIKEVDMFKFRYV